MVEKTLSRIAKRFALLGGMSARAQLWISVFLIALAGLVALVAFQTGSANSMFSALFLAAVGLFSLQRAGFILLLKERLDISEDRDTES